MILTDIIRKASEIQKGETQFFIAEKDFIYEGLEILKDSLVYCNGRDRIDINMMDFGIFQKRNVPGLVLKELPVDELSFFVDKQTSCDFEIDKLDIGWRGIWHSNHFDAWSGSYSDYLERINIIKVLIYEGITFSSIMYRFNTLTNSLDHFINVQPVKLNIQEKSVTLPGYLEISRNGASYDIIPVNGEMEYFNVSLKGALYLSETGILSGSSAEEFEAEIFGHSETEKIRISKGFRVAISHEGEIEIKVFDEAVGKIKNYQIKRINRDH